MHYANVQHSGHSLARALVTSKLSNGEIDKHKLNSALICIHMYVLIAIATTAIYNNCGLLPQFSLVAVKVTQQLN